MHGMMDGSTKTKPPAPNLVRAELERLKTSRTFAGSDRLCALLSFVAEETLAGRGDSLKEAVIGNEVYGRMPAYDPRIDSAVRVEAKRLRRKLDEYYAGEGHDADIRIGLPSGQYAITIGWRLPGLDQRRPRAGTIFEEGDGAAVAILPFRALSREPVDQSFADGLTDELIYMLGRAEGIRVASRGATFHAIGAPRQPADTAAELGVDALIQGTVRRTAGKLRVTVEVSNARGFVLWSDRFEARDEELVDLEEKIAITLLNRVRPDVSRLRAGKLHPSPEAFEALGNIVRGRQFLDLQTPNSLHRAIAQFERVTVAPDYARGHSGIADATCDMFRLGLIRHREARDRGHEAARQALTIDPSSVEAHASLATVAAWIDFDAAKAEASFTTSIGLGDSARASRIFGIFLTMRERHIEADSVLRRARGLEPLSAHQDIAEAVCHFQSRRFGAARDRLGPRSSELPAEARFHLALADINGGDTSLAAAIAAGWDDDTDGPPALAFARGEIEAHLGRPEPGRTLLASERAATHFATATLALAIGDTERAIAELSRSIEAREPDRAWIRTDIRLDGIRDTAAFQRLADAIADW
jgi:TolB-like protein